jgi:hypothetical protein
MLIPFKSEEIISDLKNANGIILEYKRFESIKKIDFNIIKTSIELFSNYYNNLKNLEWK